MITGTPRFNGLAVGEIHIDFLSNLAVARTVVRPDGRTLRHAAVSVKAAFVNVDKGSTHGWTTAGARYGGPAWSPLVHEKIAELSLLLEQELARLHFAEVTEATAGYTDNEVDEGIGEHAAGDRFEAEPG